MRAIRVQNFGAPEVLKLEEVERQAEAGEVTVRLQAIGINPVETYIRSGKYPFLPPLPYTPGTDGAGVVEAAPDGSGFFAGQRVYVAGTLGGSGSGTYAEICLSQPSEVHALPEGVSFAQGAALGVPYATAFRALFQRGRAVAGETVLIHGGTGGVGLAAIQFAVAAGLRVLATGGTEAGRNLARAQGAAAVYDHSSHTYAQEILDATDGHGVNLIVEMLANVNLSRDLSLLARRGRVALVGSRGPVEITPREAMMREADILGLTLFGATPEELAEAHAAIGQGLQNGALKPVIARQFPLAEAAAAHEAVLAAGSGGKIVLTCPAQ